MLLVLNLRITTLTLPSVNSYDGEKSSELLYVLYVLFLLRARLTKV